jgi:hypothetical protein
VEWNNRPEATNTLIEKSWDLKSFKASIGALCSSSPVRAHGPKHSPGRRSIEIPSKKVQMSRVRPGGLRVSKKLVGGQIEVASREA